MAPPVDIIAHTLSEQVGPMATIIRDNNLIKVADSARVDKKRRVYLPKTLVKEGVLYHIYANTLGQIILDPQVTIPASELWVFDNQDVLAAIDNGIAESAKGQLKKRGSFAKYVKNAP